MKILAYSALNSVTQDLIKTLVFRKNTQDIQQVRKNMAAVLTAPAKNSRPKGRFFLHFGAVDENSRQKWFDHKRKADASMPVSESE